MRNNILINRRNRLIYEAYAELWGKGQREELIWPQLTIQFHLEEKTLYRIVLKQSKIVSERQPQLPFTEKNDAAK
jgi:hypothetical protein